MGLSLLSFVLIATHCEVSHAAHIPNTQEHHDVIHGTQEADDAMTLIEPLIKPQHLARNNKSGSDDIMEEDEAPAISGKNLEIHYAASYSFFLFL